MIDVEAHTDTAVQSNVLGQMSLLDHEQVVFCQDRATGLKAIIAVHNTVLGPSLGGTRMWNYAAESEALEDVLRLSRGMTYKSSLAGLNLGGGKAVIIGDSRKDKSEALFRRFGQFVDSLGGKYITAEDVGISTQDISWVAQETQAVAGLPEYMGGTGDPSPVTAYGVYVGMKASQKKLSGSDSLEGKRVLVQGIGHVGEHLVSYLVNDGAKVIVADIFPDRVQEIVQKYGVEAVDPSAVYTVDMDIYAPCALGGTVNDETLSQLKCSIICGAANNQLKDEEKHGRQVREMGIIYAPDYLVNAGGIINCYNEVMGFDKAGGMKQTEEIYNTALRIFDLADAENIPTFRAANNLAEARIQAIRSIHSGY